MFLPGEFCEQRLQSLSQRVGHDWAINIFTFIPYLKITSYLLSLSYTHTHTHTHTHICICTYIYICLYKTHICVCVCVHACAWCMLAKSLQLCPTLCDPMDCSPPGSSVHGIRQAGILGWVATPSSRGSSWSRDWTHIFYVSCRQACSLLLIPPGKRMCVCVCVCGCVCVCVVAKSCLTLFTPWTVAHQAPLSIWVPKQEYWHELPFSPPGDLPKPGIETVTPEFAGGLILYHWASREGHDAYSWEHLSRSVCVTQIHTFISHKYIKYIHLHNN